MLFFADGEPFATGSQPYLFRPAASSDSSKRVIAEVEIQGFRVYAMLDTGAPYVICNPELAMKLGLDPHAGLESKTLRVRDVEIRVHFTVLN
jgi:hypothetical protein